tara:strand:+ start:116 stop:736 length:621 start_codon:yes stop_codon:yes gene_type:complete
MIINKHQAQEVAEILLNINAVKLQPSNFFTWSSGKKSPIYCDNRVILSYPNERAKIQKIFAEYIQEQFTDIHSIAGVATGAIAHGMMVASALELPFIYVRDKAKKHGRQNQIEGKMDKGSNIIVIEDLISTGQSSINAIKAIENSGSKVVSLISIFTYGFFNTEQLSIPCISLCDYNTLIQVALNKKIIQIEEKKILEKWQHTFSI